MGRMFVGHVAALDASGKLHQFVPDDLVPDWLDERVDACAAPYPVDQSDAQDDSDSGSESDSGADSESDETSGGESAATDSGDIAAEAGSESTTADSAPDFTKAAPAKRGRPRKQD